MTTELVPISGGPVTVIGEGTSPIVAAAGSAALFAWEEFFSSEIRNVHTRRAYERAVKRFLS